MNKRGKIIIAAVLFFGVVGALVYTSIGSAATFYMTVDELEAQKENAVGKPIKVSGLIIGDSVEFDSEKILLTFELEGKGDSSFRFPVRYAGVKPDTLNDGWEAIVEGELQPDGTFIASELLVKCPSKYEAMEKEGKNPPADHVESREPQEGSY